MDYDIPASQKDRQLPMIINLRGDEDLVQEFNWDAEQVMEFLGIKRSRLTQISGKELRVARIRRDRYLRPIYREADVRDYQEWTRATATHQSSSRAIEQAIDSLDDRFSDLMVVLQEKLLQFEDRSAVLVRQQVGRLDQAEFERFLTLRRETEDGQTAIERVQKVQEKALGQLSEQTASLHTWQSVFAELRGFLASFHQDIRTIAVAQQSMKRDLDAAQQELQIQQADLRAEMRDMQALMQELRAGQSLIIEQTREREPERQKPQRRRIRRRPWSRPTAYASESDESSPQSNP